ncbi:MAG: (2Fe-2S)-binding protein [Beijerinckiaceae bacterium]
MFNKQPDRESDSITVYVSGKAIAVSAGDSAAAAVLLAGLSASRNTPVSGAPRAPYCMMGVCFECLMVIDGVSSQQGCLITVRDGMRIDIQDGRRTLQAEF